MAFCISEDFSLAELGISVLQFWVVLYYNKHSALKEDAALQFVNKLSGASFVSSVNVPDITNIQLKNIKARSFSVECVLRPTREILESGALENNSQQGAPSQPAPASEDAKGDAAQ